MPFLVLVLCYTFIFIKLLYREHDQQDWFTNQSSSSNCCSWLYQKTFTKLMNDKTNINSSFNDQIIQQKRVNTYAKARSKTFRMVRDRFS